MSGRIVNIRGKVFAVFCIAGHDQAGHTARNTAAHSPAVGTGFGIFQAQVAGIAQTVINQRGNFFLTAGRGIGRVKAVQLAAVCELSRRMTRIQFSESYAFTTPQSIADYYMAYMCRLGHEEVHVMMLDTKQHMISECLLTKGTVNASLIAPREIFIQALKAGAVSIVLVHNHPSGDDTPSREDLAATEKVRSAGELIGIRLIDHIIIGSGHFTSLCGSWNH